MTLKSFLNSEQYLWHMQLLWPAANEPLKSIDLFNSLTPSFHSFSHCLGSRQCKSYKQFTSIALISSSSIPPSTTDSHCCCLIFSIHVLRTNFLFFDSPLCFSSLFLFFVCFWNDCPTKEGCSFNAKLFATCPK